MVIETKRIAAVDLARAVGAQRKAIAAHLPAGSAVVASYQDWITGDVHVYYRTQGPEYDATYIDRIAMVAHEVNRAYCASIGDASQLPWADAPEWQRESARNGVRFHISNPAAGPSASHDNWMAEKIAEGWTYGPVKDPEAKRHPCIAPYNELPPEQRVKDHLFICVVHALKL